MCRYNHDFVLIKEHVGIAEKYERFYDSDWKKKDELKITYILRNEMSHS